jgi:hypothetical protein
VTTELAVLAIVGTVALALLGWWRLVRDWYEEE